jgi:hypothetical protein
MALTLRRTWPDRPYPKEDWLVMDDGVEVGQIEPERHRGGRAALGAAGAASARYLTYRSWSLTEQMNGSCITLHRMLPAA